MTNPLVRDVAADYREKLVPGYETDPSAIGTNRTAEDPDGDRTWTEVHGLAPDEAVVFIRGLA